MPDWSREIRERLAGLKVDPAREQSIVEEIGQHLDDRYAELLAQGSPPETALRSALDELAGPALAAALAEAVPRPSPSLLPPAEDGPGARRLSGLSPGPPLRRAAPAPRASLRARRDPLARARHRRQHGHLPAPRRRAAAPAPDRASRGALQRPHHTGGQPERQFLGELAAAHFGDVGAHPVRAAGLLEARRLELRSGQPRLGRRGALRRTACG